MAADAAGYSRLMAQDEAATIAALNQSRLVFRVHIEAAHGRVVDTAGDSVLAVFDTVTGAVQAAHAIQASLARRNESPIESQRMRFRIGVNVGEVIEKDDGTVYGNGVNIAARLERLAEPGGVCIAGNAFEQVDGRLLLRFQFIGEHQVKNIPRPIQAYRLVLPDSAPPDETAVVQGQRRHLHRVVLGVIIFAAINLATGWWLGHAKRSLEPNSVVSALTGPARATGRALLAPGPCASRYDRTSLGNSPERRCA
jgi:adenylate cyclase